MKKQHKLRCARKKQMRTGGSCDGCGATDVKSFECQKCGRLFCPSCFMSHTDPIAPMDVRQRMTREGGMEFSHFPGKIGYTVRDLKPQKASKKKIRISKSTRTRKQPKRR